MNREFVVIGLLALAGFLVGGAYTTWRTARGMAVALGVAALLAAAGAVSWLVSG